MKNELMRAAALIPAKPMAEINAKLNAELRRWSILLTSANHGVVGPLGNTFPHAGEHHERVVVVEVPAAAGAPVDQVDLKLVSGAGAAAADAHPAPGHFAVVKLDEAIAWATQLPIPTRGASTMVSKLREAREALLVAPATAQAGQVAPADLQVRRATDELSLPELAEQFAAIEALGCDYTLSAKVCGKLFRAMTTPPEDAAGQVAVPEWRGIKAVLANLIAVAGVRIADKDEEDDQLIADASEAVRQLEARLAAAPSAPAVAQQARAQAAPPCAAEGAEDLPLCVGTCTKNGMCIERSASDPMIGKLLDQFSELPVLWGLNEPGALVRHGDVFKMLVDAGKAERAQASTAGERQEGGDRG